MSGYEIGTTVYWESGGRTAQGKIRERFEDEVTRTIKGTNVTHKASELEPAYLIVHDDGDEVLMSHSEIEATE
jgi:Hypervirulence associated proteins TUDOR domain